jgi:hypothetical protein
VGLADCICLGYGCPAIGCVEVVDVDFKLNIPLSLSLHICGVFCTLGVHTYILFVNMDMG